MYNNTKGVNMIRYTDEFKRDVVEFMIQNPEITQMQVCRDFGISKMTLYKWIRDNDQKSNITGTVPLVDHIKLQKRNKELEQENYILKRAAAYFAENLNKTPKK